MTAGPDRIEFRPFTADRIADVVAVWNAAAGEIFPLREVLFRQNIVDDPHFDPGGAVLACETASGRLEGFCVAKVAHEPLGADGLLTDRGWISCLAVHPRARRRGIGRNLVRAGEAFLRDRRRTRAILGSDPAHFFPGVPDATGAAVFFEACGYALRGEAFDLRRSLRDYRTPDAVAAALAAHPEMEIRPLAPADEPALLAFLDATFPGRWRYTVARLLTRGGTIGDVMGIVAGRRVLGFALVFHPASPWIGPSIAWARPDVGSDRPSAGGLGPMGLAPAIRGRGLGLALLDRAMVHLARLGVGEMVIDWTILRDFYGRLGFEPHRRYRHGERALRGPASV